MHATNCCLGKKREIRGVLRAIQIQRAVVCACAKSSATHIYIYMYVCVGAGRKKLGVASSRKAGQDLVQQPKIYSGRDPTGSVLTGHVAQHCLQVQGASARGVSTKVGGAESKEAVPGKDPGESCSSYTTKLRLVTCEYNPVTSIPVSCSRIMVRCAMFCTNHPYKKLELQLAIVQVHCTSTSHKARQRVKKKTVRQTARALDGIYTCMCGYIGLSTPIVYVGKHVV